MGFHCRNNCSQRNNSNSENFRQWRDFITGSKLCPKKTARYCVVHQIRPALVTKSCGEDSVDGAVRVKQNNIHICSDVLC